MESKRSRVDLGITFLETPDVRLGIVEDVAQEISQVARQSIHIRAIPAATRHRRRQPTNKLKALEVCRRLRKHSCRHAMIAVENRQGTSIIQSNQQDSRVHV